MLNQGVERHSKESAKKSQRRQVKGRAVDGMAGGIEQRAENRHPQSPDGNQANFDLATRSITRNHAADADANSDRSLQVTDVRFVNAQRVVAVDYDGQLQQSGKKPKIDVAVNGPV